MAKVHQPSKESDSEDFVIRLDPREWDGTFQEKAKGLMMAMTMIISSALIRVSGKVLSLHSRPRSRYWNPKLSMEMSF